MGRDTMTENEAMAHVLPKAPSQLRSGSNLKGRASSDESV